MSSEEKLLKDLCKNTEHLVKAVNDITKGIRKINTVLGEMQRLEKQKTHTYPQDVTYGGCINCKACWNCPDAFTEQAVSCHAYERSE